MAETEQKEMMDMDELLDNKDEVLEEEPEFISDNVEKIEQTPIIEEQTDEYINIYSGKALQSDELFRFSIKEDVNMVLVAGPYASGKTTLIVMLYRFFLKGYNKKLCFAGSKTMEGFRERSENLLIKSGQPEPLVLRTSRAVKDWYLHLTVSDEKRRKQNIFFADISGEIFSEEKGIEMMAEYFSDSENVIVVIDGEKLCDPSERYNEKHKAILLLRYLINQKIISKQTKLQIIYTKKDKMDAYEKKEELDRYLQEEEKNFREQYESYVYSLKCIYVSALSEKREEYEKLEQILQDCMETVPVDSGLDLQAIEYKVIRNFDKFQVRECAQYV